MFSTSEILFQTSIPLADLNTELQLSSQSLDLFPDRVRTRYSSSESHHATSSSLHSSLNDVHLNDVHLIDVHFNDVHLNDVHLNDVHLLQSFEESYERDCNVTELTYENSGLDIDTYKAFLENRVHSSHNDSGSDSGICDQAGSDKGGSSATRTPTNSPISMPNSGGKNSPISEDSGSYCDFTPLFSKEPVSAAPSPVNILTSAPATRSSSLRRAGAKRIDPDEANELRVVSTEDVVDGQILPQSRTTKLKPESYGPVSRDRPEYIPPRALAYSEAEDDPVNKGCYYFMACLDSLWVL